MRTTGAETVVIGCTIVSACYELAALRATPTWPRCRSINPNVMAVKLAEMFADLASQRPVPHEPGGLLPAAHQPRHARRRPRSPALPHRPRADADVERRRPQP